MIKEIYSEIVPNSFKFEPVTKDDIKNEIQNLNVKKSSTFGCIPVTICLFSSFNKFCKS